jgi:hypothetical protein
MLLRKHSKKSVLRCCIAAMLALVCIVVSFVTSTASAETKYQEGDVMLFGSYEQNNIRYDGAEPIEWIVLLSQYALDSERYHYRKESVSWDTCSVRDWLNTTFYEEAFTRSEQRSILSSGTSVYDDYVFLLSDVEAETYLPRAKDRICKATVYGSCQNVYVNPTTGGSWWLLRTTGDDGSKFAMSVNSDGTIDYNGGHVESDRGTVRPAIWVNIGEK